MKQEKGLCGARTVALLHILHHSHVPYLSLTLTCRVWRWMGKSPVLMESMPLPEKQSISSHSVFHATLLALCSSSKTLPARGVVRCMRMHACVDNAELKRKNEEESRRGWHTLSLSFASLLFSLFLSAPPTQLLSALVNLRMHACTHAPTYAPVRRS